jgi:hypothetical protein
MKNINTILFLLLFATIAYSQDTRYFTKKVAWSDIHSVETIYQKSNGNYLLGADAKPSGPNFWHAYFVELDNKANILQIVGDTLESYSANVGKMICENDSCLMAAFHLPADQMNSYSYYLTYNAGTFNYEDIVNFNEDNGLHTCIKTADNHYLMAGYYNPATSFGHELYLVKLDANYNLLWDTVYYQIPITFPPNGNVQLIDYTYNTYFNDIVQGPGDTYYLLATADDNWSWNDEGFVLIVKIDGQGNILWAKQYGLGLDEQTYSLTNTLDGGLLLTAVTDQSSFDQCVGYVRKLDANGQVQWTWQAPAAVPQIAGNVFLGYPHKAIQLADSSYLITGDWGIIDDSDSDGTLVKLSPDGTFLWQQAYGNPYNDYFYDLIVADHDSTGKSGYVVAARTDTIGDADIWFLKLNCMGLLTEPQAAFTTYQTGNSPLEMAFVNESQFVYPENIDGGHYVWNFGDGSPPLICGRGYDTCPDTLLHHYPTQGQYNATLTAIVCNDTSVVQQNVVVTWTGIGNAPPNTQHEQLQITPNPTKGICHISYQNIGSQGGKLPAISLYDSSGKLFRYLPLSTTSGVLSLDTRNFPVGVYYCQIVGSSTQAQRLVVVRE